MAPDDFRPDDASTASRELDRRSRQQADVARLGVLALSGVPISALFGEALRSIRAHLGVGFAGVIRMDGDSAQLVAADSFLPRAIGLLIAPGPLAVLLRSTGGPIIVPDLSHET